MNKCTLHNQITIMSSANQELVVRFDNLSPINFHSDSDSETDWSDMDSSSSSSDDGSDTDVDDAVWDANEPDTNSDSDSDSEFGDDDIAISPDYEMLVEHWRLQRAIQLVTTTLVNTNTSDWDDEIPPISIAEISSFR